MRWGTLSVFLAMAVLAPAAEAAPSMFITHSTDRMVSAYSIGPNGAPSPVAGSPYTVGFTPAGVAVSPDARYAYVANLESNFISAFSIGHDGGLSPVSGSPFPTSSGPWGVAVSPDGAHLYVANSTANSVSGYSIAADGSLSPVPGSPFSTGSLPDLMRSNGVAVTPDGEHLYVTNLGAGGSVSAFSIAADGSLSPVSGSPFDAGPTARPVSVTPDGKYLYVGNATGENISVYSIATDGVLSQVAGSPFATEGAPLGLAIPPSGAHLYTAHVAWAPNVWGYSIGAGGGLGPVPGSPFPTGGLRGNSVTVSPSGRFLYSTNNESDDVSVFSIAATGSLKSISGSPFDTGNGPLQIVVTPDQGPVAKFSATPAPAGNPVVLDASASGDSDGSVASYYWDFGDGQTAVTSTATTTHVYEDPGDYTVSLTATDNSGCSTAQTFTGQTVGCNGSLLAQISHQLTVPPGAPLSISVAGSGSGSVTSSPAGIDCPGACTYSFEPGTQVALTPVPASGSAFAGWSGDGCSGTEPCEVTVEADTEVTAAFDKLPSPPVGSCTSGDGCPKPPLIDPPPAGPPPMPAQLQIKRVQERNGVVVGGTIARAARGAVRVKVSAYVDGRRVGVSRRARIAEGRWRARLRFVPFAVGENATFYLSARFQGSPGVQGGSAERRVRGLPAT